MDMKIASNVAKQMASFFKVFKDVEEVLEAAAQAQNLKGEVEQQISDLIAQRTKCEEDLRNVQAHLQRSKGAFQEQLEKQEKEQVQRVQSYEEELGQKQRKGCEELAALAADLESARKAHSEFLAAASAERESLEKAVKGLRDQLDKLKAKVGAL